MAAVESLRVSLLDAQKILDTWAATDGPTDEERIEFAEGALKALAEDDNQQFQDNVKQVGVWANQVDKSFENTTRGFEDMVALYGTEFPDLADFLNEWRTYRARWETYLRQSRDVASEHIVILRRFDKVFLEMVEMVRTDADREEVIKELQQFIDEDHSDSTEMSQNFLNLKRDIENFARKFAKWIVDTGIELENEAKELQEKIAEILKEIEDLDKKIQGITLVLTPTGIIFFILRIFVPLSPPASWIIERNEKETELLRTQLKLAEVNRRQVELAHLKTQFDALEPDITLICEKLVLFAEIWSSVRSQAVQFQGHLRGGMDTESNMRFRMEVKVAREVCLPLMGGLQKYATELENRGQ